MTRMKISNDPSIHRNREEQMIQHLEKLLADERLRIDTAGGRRSVTDLSVTSRATTVLSHLSG